MQREIGGYIELQRGTFPVFPGAVHLNSARNCLAYLIEARGITKIWIPDFMCDSIRNLCAREGVALGVYQIAENLEPNWDTVLMQDGDYLYLVDYYGQLTDACVEQALRVSKGRLAIDEAQSLYAPAREGLDTLYSPRKFLGIPDGGILCTSARLNRSIPQDESRDHMSFLLGRTECKASVYYDNYKDNNERFEEEPLKRMSALTERLISAVDGEDVVRKRLQNYRALAAQLDDVNGLSLKEPVCPFAYPLLVENGPAIRGALAKKGLFIPTLWPNVLTDEQAGEVARRYAADILPLPCDQRYAYGDMERMVNALREEGVLAPKLAGKKLAILGGTQIACEIVHAAKKLGMHVSVIDYNPPEDSPAKRIADQHALISVADADQVASYLKENQIDGVITGYSDTLLPMYADICAAADLPCYGTRAQFEVFTDKVQWKPLCHQFGVPTAQTYDESILDLSEDQIAFPLFVKPSDGAGARGTSVARNKEQLVAAVEYARSFARNGVVLLEDYLEGPELTVFWVFIDGRYEVFLLGNRLVKDNQEDTIPLPTGYSFPAAITPLYLEKVAPAVRCMLESQGVKNGMMFMQCIVRDGMPYVYDIGYRLTGSLEQYINEAVSGYSVMDMLLQFAVTGQMTDDPLIYQKIQHGLYAPCYNVSFLMKPGVIAQFEGLELLDQNPTVIAYSKAHVEGEELPPEAKGELRQIALRVLGAVESVDNLADEMLKVQESVQILDPQGNNLVLPGFEGCDFYQNLYQGGVR